MKTMFSLTLALVMMGLVASCGSKSGAGAAAKQYMEYVAAGQYDQFLDGAWFGADLSAEEVTQTKALWKTVLSSGSVADEKGGVASIEILSEKMGEGGRTADVVFKRTYGNGETEEETLVMVLIDGTWLMDANQ